MSLKITNLQVALSEQSQKEPKTTQAHSILSNITLDVQPGKVCVIIGPNGSGKSSLGKALLGHPDYKVLSGQIELDDVNLTELSPNERAQTGLFLAGQYPTEIPGVNLSRFLRLAYNARLAEDKQLSIYTFRKLLREKLAQVGLPESFMERNLNEGFSGGEKKKCEILQLLLFRPKYAILDETDSGLDVDAINTVFKSLATAREENPEMGIILITHYAKILEFLPADSVYVLKAGKIVKSGGKDLAHQILTEGYAEFAATEN